MDVRNFTFMFYGFTAAWVIVAGYLILLALREKKLNREMRRLGRLLERTEPRP